MIQVYSQEKRMEKVPASQYYLSKDTYQGVHFEIKEEVREEFDVFVRLHGACTAPDDSYAVINLTWPIQPDGLERIRYVAFSSSGNGNFGEVHCGFTYSDETGAHWVFFEKGRKEMDFHPDHRIVHGLKCDIRILLHPVQTTHIQAEPDLNYTDIRFLFSVLPHCFRHLPEEEFLQWQKQMSFWSYMDSE